MLQYEEIIKNFSKVLKELDDYSFAHLSFPWKELKFGKIHYITTCKEYQMEHKVESLFTANSSKRDFESIIYYSLIQIVEKNNICPYCFKERLLALSPEFNTAAKLIADLEYIKKTTLPQDIAEIADDFNHLTYQYKSYAEIKNHNKNLNKLIKKTQKYTHKLLNLYQEQLLENLSIIPLLKNTLLQAFHQDYGVEYLHLRENYYQINNRLNVAVMENVALNKIFARWVSHLERTKKYRGEKFWEDYENYQEDITNDTILKYLEGSVDSLFIEEIKQNPLNRVELKNILNNSLDYWEETLVKITNVTEKNFHIVIELDDYYVEPYFLLFLRGNNLVLLEKNQRIIAEVPAILTTYLQPDLKQKRKIQILNNNINLVNPVSLETALILWEPLSKGAYSNINDSLAAAGLL